MSPITRKMSSLVPIARCSEGAPPAFGVEWSAMGAYRSGLVRARANFIFGGVLNLSRSSAEPQPPRNNCPAVYSREHARGGNVMRRATSLARPAAVVAASLAAAAAYAHHSFAPHFDASKPVSISGTVTEYESRNPHSYVHIAATDENGKTQEYVCESHGVTQLTRNGITPDMLKAGTRLRVEGSQSRNSPYMCFFDSVE